MPVRDMYHVEVDAAGWPLCGENEMPEACKSGLMEHVLAVLRECRPLLTHELYQRVRNRAKADPRCAAFNKAALLDWLYACVVRAARAVDAEQLWHAPPPEPTRRKSW